MKDDFQAAASEFLKSDSGRKLRSFASSAEGRDIRERCSGEGEQIRQAVMRGDMASAEAMLKSFLSSEDGQKLARQVQDMMG